MYRRFEGCWYLPPQVSYPTQSVSCNVRASGGYKPRPTHVTLITPQLTAADYTECRESHLTLRSYVKHQYNCTRLDGATCVLLGIPAAIPNLSQVIPFCFMSICKWRVLISTADDFTRMYSNVSRNIQVLVDFLLLLRSFLLLITRQIPIVQFEAQCGTTDAGHAASDKLLELHLIAAVCASQNLGA
jgi:hypothetical protein